MIRVGVDVDGILANFQTGFETVLVKTSGRDLFPYHPYNDPPCWNWATDHLGYTKEEDAAAWEFVKKSQTFWMDLDPYPDTREVLGALSDMQYDGTAEVYFITNRMGIRPKAQTEMFLARYGAGFCTVLVSAHKGLSAAALELDLYIDDKPSNCDDVVKARGLKTKTFLMDRPWNQDYDAKYVTRVKSVLEIFQDVTTTV